MNKYTSDLKTMNKEEILKRNSKSQKDIKLGKLVDQKDVKKHFTSRISIAEPRKKTTK